jgi:hypothetical protein
LENLDSDSCVKVANGPESEDQLERFLLDVYLVELHDSQCHPGCMLTHFLSILALPVVMREDVFIGLEIFQHGGNISFVVSLSKK